MHWFKTGSTGPTAVVSTIANIEGISYGGSTSIIELPYIEVHRRIMEVQPR